MPDREKIAIIRRNGLGDLLCAYPLVLYLREKNPSAAITLFVDETNAALLPYFPFKEHSVVFRKKGNKYLNVLRCALKNRREKYDMAISAKTSPMKLINLFLFLLGAKKRIACVENGFHKRLINAPVVYNPDSEEHQALQTLKMVDPKLDHVPKKYHPRLQIPDDIKKKYSAVGVSNTPLLVLTASTTKAASRLDAKRYAAIASQVALRYNFSISLLAQKADAKRAETIAAHLTAPYQLHFPRNFDAFMVLLEKSDLFFVGDGGVAHIGAAFGKRALVLFGQASLNIWKPLSEQAKALYHPEDVNQLSDDEMIKILSVQCEEVLHERICL